jgi:hypothetical protein
MKRAMFVIAAFAAAAAVQAADNVKSKQDQQRAQAAQKQKVAQCERGANARKMKGERRAGYIRQCAGAAAVGGAKPPIDPNVPASGG